MFIATCYYQGVHIAGPGCTEVSGGFWASFCSGGDSGAGGYPDNNYNDTNNQTGNNGYIQVGNGTTNGGDPVDNPDVYTAPVEPPTIAEQISVFITLNDFQQIWLNKPNNEDVAEDIRNYLLNDGDLAFAEEAMEAIMEGGEVDFPNKIILDSTFVNNVKLKCVYDKLVKDNSSLFQSTIGAFIDDPKFNLTFRVGNCATTNDQCTDDNDPFNIIVTFEDVNTNPIEMAQAILHEAIHAEIARFVKLFQLGADVNNRSRLFQLYAHYKNWTDTVDPDFNWDNAADHQYMIENYINKIALALREFDNNRYPLVNYKDYAWDGLRAYDYRGVLTDAEEDNNINLRVTQTNINIQVCN